MNDPGTNREGEAGSPQAHRTPAEPPQVRGGWTPPEPMTLDEAKDLAERLAYRDPNKMEYIGPRRWDAYRYVVPAVIAALGLIKPKIEDDVIVVREIMHAQQRAMTPPDSGWGNMSYLKGSYDDTEPFKAALSAYRTARARGESA